VPVPSYDIFHWNCYIPDIHQLQKLKFLGTNLNGRAASGGTLAPEPAAHHRGGPLALRILVTTTCPYFRNFFRNLTSPRFEMAHESINQSIDQSINVGLEIGTSHLGRRRSEIGRLCETNRTSHTDYGVAAISRLLNIRGLFCRIWSLS